MTQEMQPKMASNMRSPVATDYIITVFCPCGTEYKLDFLLAGPKAAGYSAVCPGCNNCCAIRIENPNGFPAIADKIS